MCTTLIAQVEGDAEEAEDTLAGVTVGALRNWLRQVHAPFPVANLEPQAMSFGLRLYPVYKLPASL
jgi:hypothetical protein